MLCHFQTVLGSIVFALAIIGFSTTWWYVYYDDCIFGGDASRSLNLKLGICTDGDDDCTSWHDIDNEDDGGDSLDYISAYGLCVTSAVFAAFFVIGTCAGFVPAVKNGRVQPVLRIVLIILMVLVAIFLISAMSSTQDTWYTDSDNYGFLAAACETQRSGVSIGWIAALIATILAFITFFVAIIPCCICAEKTEQATDSFVGADAASDAKR